MPSGRRASRTIAISWALAATVLAAACGDTAATPGDAAAQDAPVADAPAADAPAADAGPPDAVGPDVAPAGPRLTLSLERADTATAYPPVRAVATLSGAAGVPWPGAVTIRAWNPDGFFTPTVGPVTAGGDGTWSATVAADRSGEVTIEASGMVDGTFLAARATALFLPYVDAAWGIPRAVASLNTPGQEDSIAVAPDGRTLFFSYTPLLNCNYMPAGLGDPPDKSECQHPFGPAGTPERPCSQGLGTDGLVTSGLFGDTDAWPWVKSLEVSYVSTRRADGSFANPVCASFDDDGTLMEVSPSSGPESPRPGEPYHFFFGYPDWLDLDLAHDGSLFAVATAVGGEPIELGGPITAISTPPANLAAETLTGPLNDARENAAQVAEFRVYRDPQTGDYALYFERQLTADSTFDVVTSALTGTYPVGDWAAPEPVPGAVNTDHHHEGFPWPVDLDDGKYLFHVSFPTVEWSEASRVLVSAWDGAAWGAPAPVLEPELSAADGAIFMVALPSVSSGDFGVELFFVYVVQHGTWIDLQIGVVPRL